MFVLIDVKTWAVADDTSDSETASDAVNGSVLDVAVFAPSVAEKVSDPDPVPFPITSKTTVPLAVREALLPASTVTVEIPLPPHDGSPAPRREFAGPRTTDGRSPERAAGAVPGGPPPVRAEQETVIVPL